MNDWNSSVRFPINTPVATKTSQSLPTAPTISNKLAAKTGITKPQGLPLCLVIFPIVPKVVPEGWAVTVSPLMLSVIFSITPFLYQTSSVCYAHSQMQKRSMVYLFWTMGYSDQPVRNKTFNSN